MRFSAPAPATRYLLGVTLIGLILGYIIILQLTGPNALGGPSDIFRPIGGDFLNYWAAPQIAHQNLRILFNVDSYIIVLQHMVGPDIYDHNWSYPLFALFLLNPLTLFNYATAFTLWSIGGIAAFLLTARQFIAPTHRRIALLCLALSPALIVNLYTGQNGLFTAALALGALSLLSKRPITAGVLIGLLAVKPQLGILFPVLLIATRNWRAFFSAALTVAALVVASLCVHGIDAWREYLSFTSAFQWSLVSQAAPQASGLLTYHLMAPGLLPNLRLAGVSLDHALITQLVLSLGVIISSYRAFRSGRDPMLLLAAGTLLVTPYAYNYDMAFLSAALVINWCKRPPMGAGQRWIHGLAYLLPFAVYKFNALLLPVAPMILIGLYIIIVRGCAARQDVLKDQQ